MLDKITFVNGTIVTKEYLNEVQKGTVFSGTPPRADFYSISDDDNSTWNIGERDKIKDYEIANPREEKQTSIGRLAYDGIILGGPSGITQVSEATFSKPRTFSVIVGSDQSVTIDAGGTQKGVIVEAGSIVLSTGELFSWPRQVIGLISSTGKNYIYIGEKGADFSSLKIIISESLPSSASVPYVPLAELNLTNGDFNVDAEQNVVGTGVIDLRPNLFVGALNNYSTGVLKNTSIINVSTQISSWERGIIDTRNGSVIITLPADPSDNDRVAIVDLEGTFDSYPVVLRPAQNTRINDSIDDWVVNIRDAHIELFYHAATAEWRFEESPGAECNPKLGTFISCGGREFIGVRTAGECPDGELVPAEFPNPSEGVYRYEAATQKCYKEVNSNIAVYSNGEGGLIKVFKAGRCSRAGSSGLGAEGILKNILYVDAAIGDDSITNNGTDSNVPFRTIERALLEAARASRRGIGPDAYDTTVIELAPGDYYIDNAPGVNSISGINTGENYIRQVDTGFSSLSEWTEQTPYVLVDTNDSTSTQPPVSLNLGRVIYTKAGGIGTISKLERESLTSSRWKVYLNYVQGTFSPNEALFFNRLSDFNPSEGGLVVPRGISINGVDLRKVRIRPMYVPALTPGQNVAQDRRTYMFKVTGGTYISLLTFADNQQFTRSHNTVTCIGFASEAEIRGSETETSYYQKVGSLFKELDGWGGDSLIPIDAETRIVAPLAADKADRSQDLEQNQTGTPTPDLDPNSPNTYPGAALLKVNESGSTTFYKLPDVNSTRSSSPYVFNCSVRSIFGLNGMWVDGSRVSGFRSMVTAQFTQVSLQTDPNCFETPSIGYFLDPPTNKETGEGKKYKNCIADPLKYRHWGFRGSYDATIQLVSCFVIGNADHFISDSGSDLSITNSCSDFGDISLRSQGFKDRAFSQDEGVPQGTYLGTKITEIIPPLPLSYTTLANGRAPTITDTIINTGITLDYPETLNYVETNSLGSEPPTIFRVYIQNSDIGNVFSLNNPPSASDVAFGQYSYTKDLGDGQYALAGGDTRPNRKRIYISGFDENGSSILYTGNLQLQSEGTEGFAELDGRSKIFAWDAALGKWYITITTAGIPEEFANANADDGGDENGDGFLTKRFDYAFRYKLSSSTDSQTLIFKSLDFIFDKSPVKIIRGVDQRTDEERIYKVILEGYERESGIRTPQSYYILEKQKGVAGYPLNGGNELGDDPLVITQVQTFDSYARPGAVDTKYPGKYVVLLTQSSDARSVFLGDVYPSQDRDEPELTEDPDNSITKVALQKMKDRPSVFFSAPVATGTSSIFIKTKSNSGTAGFLTSLRRPSVIRASGHTWEWTGYLNYDTAFPTYQGEPLEQDYALGKIIVEEFGGRVYATGMNEEGNYYLGTTVFDLRSGEQFSIPLKAENEVGNVTNQVLNNVVIKSNLLVSDNASLVLGRGTKIFLSQDTEFKSLTTGDITASKNPISAYASTSRAGLVQLASLEEIRGAAAAKNAGTSDKVVVTARNLAEELNIRFENNLTQGTGINIQSQQIDLTPNDPDDDPITQFTVGVDPAYSGFTPVGGIIMWSGSVVPTGWALCNGDTVNGVSTPNLQDRFIIGSGANAVGSTGGPSIAGATDGTTLSVDDIPRHSHGLPFVSGTVSTGEAGSASVAVPGDAEVGAGGSGASALRNLNDSNSHSHTLSGVTDIKPAWYALAFIIRVS